MSCPFSDPQVPGPLNYPDLDSGIQGHGHPTPKLRRFHVMMFPVYLTARGQELWIRSTGYYG